MGRYRQGWRHRDAGEDPRAQERPDNARPLWQEQVYKRCAHFRAQIPGDRPVFFGGFECDSNQRTKRIKPQYNQSVSYPIPRTYGTVL